MFKDCEISYSQTATKCAHIKNYSELVSLQKKKAAYVTRAANQLKKRIGYIFLNKLKIFKTTLRKSDIFALVSTFEIWHIARSCCCNNFTYFVGNISQYYFLIILHDPTHKKMECYRSAKDLDSRIRYIRGLPTTVSFPLN